METSWHFERASHSRSSTRPNLLNVLWSKPDKIRCLRHVRSAPNNGLSRTSRHFAFGPKPAVSSCSKHVLFDHLVSDGEKLVGYRETERLGGREINDQIEFSWLLDWNSAGFAPRSILSTRSAARRHMLGQFGP